MHSGEIRTQLFIKIQRMGNSLRKQLVLLTFAEPPAAAPKALIHPASPVILEPAP